MNDTPITVSDLRPDEAALVDYPKYRERHPLLPDSREEARQAAGARILTLPPSGATLVYYSEYDGFQLEPSEPQRVTTAAMKEAAVVDGQSLSKKEL